MPKPQLMVALFVVFDQHAGSVLIFLFPLECEQQEGFPISEIYRLVMNHLLKSAP